MRNHRVGIVAKGGDGRRRRRRITHLDVDRLGIAGGAPAAAQAKTQIDGGGRGFGERDRCRDSQRGAVTAGAAAAADRLRKNGMRTGAIGDDPAGGDGDVDLSAVAACAACADGRGQVDGRDRRLGIGSGMEGRSDPRGGAAIAAATANRLSDNAVGLVAWSVIAMELASSAEDRREEVAPVAMVLSCQFTVTASPRHRRPAPTATKRRC